MRATIRRYYGFRRWAPTWLLWIYWRTPHRSMSHCDGRYYDYLEQLKIECQALPYQPKISIIMPLYKIPVQFFRETLNSVGYQVYENWEVCIVDDNSQDPKLTNIVEEFSRIFPGRVSFATHTQNQHISITSNHCIELSSGSYIALLDHDDWLMPHALAEMVRHINEHNQPDILYSDERKADAKGRKYELPYYKPRWCRFMHLAMNYTTHFTVYHKALVQKVGGFRAGFEGSQDHDLMLRMVEATQKPIVAVQLCLYQWRVHEASTALAVQSKPYAALAGQKAVAEACESMGRPAVVEFEPQTAHYRVKFKLPQVSPLVSVILIPSRHQCRAPHHLEKLIQNISYDNYEILADKQGDLSDTDKVSVSRYIDFSKSLSVSELRGDYVVFLKDDIHLSSPDWIQELLRFAQFPEVGVVGGKVIDAKGRIDSAGLVAQSNQQLCKIGKSLNVYNSFYCGIVNTAHEILAHTADCVMIKKSTFTSDLALGRDVDMDRSLIDLCIKLRRLARSHLYTPYVQTYINRSRPRERQPSLHGSWGDVVALDPLYHAQLGQAGYFLPSMDTEWMDITWHSINPNKLPSPRDELLGL